MSLEKIAAYVLDATAFALPMGVLCLLGLALWKRRAFRWGTEGLWVLFVTYSAALLKITAIRQAGWEDFSLHHSMESLRLIPVWGTWLMLKQSLWLFFYNVLGNILWFLPLGLFLRWIRKESSWKSALAIGAGVSFAIELTQWLLQSGISDVNDVLLNAAGTVLGWWLFPWVCTYWKRWRKR